MYRFGLPPDFLYLEIQLTIAFGLSVTILTNGLLPGMPMHKGHIGPFGGRFLAHIADSSCFVHVSHPTVTSRVKPNYLMPRLWPDVNGGIRGAVGPDIGRPRG